MRKIGLLLITVLFMFFALGCGGGGSTTSSAVSPGDTTGTALPSGYGLIKLTINQESARAPVDGSPLALAPAGTTLPAPDSVRVAARLVQTVEVPVVDDNGTPTGEFTQVIAEVYRKIVDVSLPAATVEIAVPAADGYVVEVLSSVLRPLGTDNVHFMLKHGKTTTPVNVTAGATTSGIAITANPIAAGLTITPPDNVVAGSKYTIPVIFGDIPLSRTFYFQQYVDTTSNTAPAGFFADATTSPKVPSFTAQEMTTSPTGQVFWDLYFQGLFHIDASWQSQAELSNPGWYKKFVFYYPNPSAGWDDDPLVTKLYPLGTIDISVTLSPQR